MKPNLLTRIVALLLTFCLLMDVGVPSYAAPCRSAAFEVKGDLRNLFSMEALSLEPGSISRKSGVLDAAGRMVRWIWMVLPGYNPFVFGMNGGSMGKKTGKPTSTRSEVPAHLQPDDFKTAVLRALSRLRQIGDLDRLRTMGFFALMEAAGAREIKDPDYSALTNNYCFYVSPSDYRDIQFARYQFMQEHRAAGAFTLDLLYRYLPDIRDRLAPNNCGPYEHLARIHPEITGSGTYYNRRASRRVQGLEWAAVGVLFERILEEEFSAYRLEDAVFKEAFYFPHPVLIVAEVYLSAFLDRESLAQSLESHWRQLHRVENQREGQVIPDPSDITLWKEKEHLDAIIVHLKRFLEAAEHFSFDEKTKTREGSETASSGEVFPSLPTALLALSPPAVTAAQISVSNLSESLKQTLSVPESVWDAAQQMFGDRIVFEWIGRKILGSSPELKGSLILDLASSWNSEPSEGLLTSGLADQAHMITWDADAGRWFVESGTKDTFPGRIILRNADVADVEADYHGKPVGTVIMHHLTLRGASNSLSYESLIRTGARKAFKVLREGGWFVIQTDESDLTAIMELKANLEEIGYRNVTFAYRQRNRHSVTKRNDYIILMLAEKPPPAATAVTSSAPFWERSDCLEHLGQDTVGAEAVKKVLEEVKFDEQNFRLRNPAQGGDYAISPFAASDALINHEAVMDHLRDEALNGSAHQRRVYDAFRFFVYGALLTRTELENLFGPNNASAIAGLINSGFIKATGQDRFETNGLSLASTRLINGKVLYVFVDTPPYLKVRDPFSARVYLGADSFLLLNSLQADRGFSGTGAEMGAGSGVLSFGVLETYPDAQKMILFEIDERARNVELFNAALNGLRSRVAVARNRTEFEAALQESGASHVLFAVSNPPFHAIPEVIKVDEEWAKLLPDHVAVRENSAYLNLRGLFIKAGWGGTDGLSIVRQFLDLLEGFTAEGAQLLLYSLQWAGTEEQPTRIQDLVAQKGWTMEFEKQSTTVQGSDPQYIFQTFQTAQKSALEILLMVIGANPLIWEYRDALLPYAREIFRQYEELGIDAFHAGFALITVSHRGRFDGEQTQHETKRAA